MRKNSVYSLHPGFAMEESSLASLKERTGKTLEEWIRIVKKSGPPTQNKRREWLKSAHGFTTNYASWITQRAEGRGGADDYDPDAMVDEMFAGKKAGLVAIYEKLLALGFAAGKDVKACPCKTMVPLYRNHVFAQIKPSTNKRIDFGFALKDTPPSGRLVSTGGFEKRDRISHRIPISSIDEIDAEVKSWLKRAYQMDA